MKLTNIQTSEVLVEFDKNDQPLFHDESLARELFSFGIQIPPESRGTKFNNKTIIYPATSKDDHKTAMLFKKALIEIYYNPLLLKRLSLEWVTN